MAVAAGIAQAGLGVFGIVTSINAFDQAKGDISARANIRREQLFTEKSIRDAERFRREASISREARGRRAEIANAAGTAGVLRSTSAELGSLGIETKEQGELAFSQKVGAASDEIFRLNLSSVSTESKSATNTARSQLFAGITTGAGGVVSGLNTAGGEFDFSADVTTKGVTRGSNPRIRA